MKAQVFAVLVIFMIGWIIAMAGVMIYWLDLTNRLVLIGLGVVSMAALWWVPWLARVVPTRPWIPSVVLGIGFLLTGFTGHVWAVVVLFAITLMLFLLEVFGLAKLRQVMQDEQPDGRRPQ